MRSAHYSFLGDSLGRRKTYSEKVVDHIAKVAIDQRVHHILHFTQLANLSGILNHGLLSRSTLRQANLGYNVFVSDVDRLDNNENAISVSVSYFYPEMFDAKRYRSGKASWMILGLDPSLLWKLRCFFFARGSATNATKYERGAGSRDSGFAFARLFEDFTISKDGCAQSFRETNDLPPSCPTYPDAEVQVMESIRPDFIKGVWVEKPGDADKVEELLETFGRAECEVVVSPFKARIARSQYSWG